MRDLFHVEEAFRQQADLEISEMGCRMNKPTHQAITRTPNLSTRESSHCRSPNFLFPY